VIGPGDPKAPTIQQGPRQPREAIVATSITWTDGIGAGTLTTASRFRQIASLSGSLTRRRVGDEDESLGTGQLYTFTFRNDYLVTFELRQIPQSSMAI
jgi:hypothetical protein